MPYQCTSCVPRLMEKVLKTVNRRDSTTVYIDNVIVFSETLEDHLQHLQQVLTCLGEFSLKLKLSKCHFLWETVEYLGITADGFKPNPGCHQVKFSYFCKTVFRTNILLLHIHPSVCQDCCTFTHSNA